jgi:hypothetical protein
VTAKAAPTSGLVTYQEKKVRSSLFLLCHIVRDVTPWTDDPTIPKRRDNNTSLVSLSKDEGIKEVLMTSFFRFLPTILYVMFLIVVPLALFVIVLEVFMAVAVGKVVAVVVVEEEEEGEEDGAVGDLLLLPMDKGLSIILVLFVPND